MKRSLAIFISAISMPYFMAPITMFLLLRRGFLAEVPALQWTLLAMVFIVVLPASFITIQIARKKITNHNVDVRSQRHQVYLFAFFSLLLGLGAFYLMQAPDTLFILFGTILLVGFLAFMLTVFVHKTSAHMMGMGLSFGLLFFTYPQVSLGIFILGIFVAWSRYILKKHTIPELISGSVVSVGISLAVSGLAL